jgi:hypothetical protein
MIRFIMFLLGRPYETCKSCETLKQQLAFVNDEKKQLTETLLSIVKPKTFESPPVELNPIVATSGLFSRRRAAMEERDRMEAKILSEKKNLGVPDNLKDINQLEKELDIPQEA